MKDLYKITIILLVAFLLLGATSACNGGGSQNSSTNVQEQGVDEGDIVKVSDEGIVYSLQSDGLTAIKLNQGIPVVIDYISFGNIPCVPLEMYIYGQRVITLVGELDQYYAGDYRNYRSADYSTLNVSVYDVAYMAEKNDDEQLLDKSLAYTFTTTATLRESRVLDGYLYLFTEHDYVYSEDVNEEEDIRGYSDRQEKLLSVENSLYINVSHVTYSQKNYTNGEPLYNNGNTYEYLSRAIYIEPSKTLKNSSTLTAMYKIQLTSNPKIVATEGVYSLRLQSVYMSENSIFPVFYGTSNHYGSCMGMRAIDNLMLTKFDKSFKMTAKKYIADARVPSRYAFKELDGYLFATIERNLDVYVYSFTPQLDNADVERLCYSEELKAVNYTEEDGKHYCYAVTFRKVDPLYKADISNPENIVVMSELSITGYSVYLHKFPPDYTVGIGYEATTNGEIIGAKVSLFNTADEQTFEINSIIIPNVEHAEILSDARALLVHNNYIIFGFALSRYDETSDGNVYKQGFYLFGVKDGKLVDIAYLSNFEGGFIGSAHAFYDYTVYRKTIRRAVFLNEYMLTVSDGVVASYSLPKLSDGDKTPYAITDTSILSASNDNFQKPIKQDGVFFEG